MAQLCFVSVIVGKVVFQYAESTVDVDQLKHCNSHAANSGSDATDPPFHRQAIQQPEIQQHQRNRRLHGRDVRALRIEGSEVAVVRQLLDVTRLCETGRGQQRGRNRSASSLCAKDCLGGGRDERTANQLLQDFVCRMVAAPRAKQNPKTVVLNKAIVLAI